MMGKSRFQRLVQLTGIVELSGLTNAQTTTTDNEDLLDIDQFAAGLDESAGEVALSGGSAGGLRSQATKGARERAQLLRSPRRRGLGQSETRSRRVSGSLGGEWAQSEGGATRLRQTALTQEGGRSLPATSSENHCALRW